MDTGNGGNGGSSFKEKSELVLTLDRTTFQLSITGTAMNLDEAIAMLDMARRDCDNKLRATVVAQSLDAPGRVRVPIFSRGH